MSEQNGSGGAPAEGSANSNQDPKKDTVSYETHRKLLDEKKRIQDEKAKLEEQVNAAKAEKEADERKKLEEQGNFKKLLEQERADKELLKQNHEALKQDLENAKKRAAVLKHIKGVVPEKAREWINVTGVAVNEDGSVNPDTAMLVAQEFEKEYYFAVQRDKNGGGLPNDAARGGTAKLTVSQWNALKTSKEMKEQMNNVDWDSQ